MASFDVTSEINKYLQSFASLIEECSSRSREDFKPHLIFCGGLLDFINDNRPVFSIIYSHLQYVELNTDIISKLDISADAKLEMYEIYVKEKDFSRGIERLLIKEEFDDQDVPWIKTAGKIIEYLTPKNINYLNSVFFDSAYEISINELKEAFPSLKKESFLEKDVLN